MNGRVRAIGSGLLVTATSVALLGVAAAADDVPAKRAAARRRSSRWIRRPRHAPRARSGGAGEERPGRRPQVHRRGEPAAVVRRGDSEHRARTRRRPGGRRSQREPRQLRELGQRARLHQAPRESRPVRRRERLVGCRRRLPVHARDVEHERRIRGPHRSRRCEPRRTRVRPIRTRWRSTCSPHRGSDHGEAAVADHHFLPVRAKVAAVTAAIVGITGAAVALSIEPTAGAVPNARSSRRQPEGTAGACPARCRGRGAGACAGRADDARLPGRAGGRSSAPPSRPRWPSTTARRPA